MTAQRRVRPHGTYSKYVTEKCRCLHCKRANRDRNRRWARTKAMAALGMADPLWVDAEPVRRHVRSLMAAGMGVPRIQQTSGVSKGVLTRLVYGAPGRGEAPSRKIRPGNAAKLLALRVPRPADSALADSALVDATGTRRRLQALVAVGWSGAELMRRIGVIGTDFPKLAHRDRVLARTERAVRALYDQLWDAAPPASTRFARATRSRALSFAAARGWAPPMAWDDATIDDPAARAATGEPDDDGQNGDLVDEVAVERAIQTGDPGHLTAAERTHLVATLLHRGASRTQIARLLRCSGSVVNTLINAARRLPHEPTGPDPSAPPHPSASAPDTAAQDAR